MTPRSVLVVLFGVALLCCGLALGRSACADERAPTRTYSLGECLALTERNHPALFAARARLDAMRAQLEEARVAPASFVGLSSRFGVVPNAPAGSQPSPDFVTQGVAVGLGPLFQVGVSATVPLYTFGKISSARRAAEAHVRLGEWDVEKERQQIRVDVKRAYFSLALARDMAHLAEDALSKLDDAIASIQKKLDEGDGSVDRADRLRLEVSRDELLARIADAKRGATAASGALRFYTGIQTGFDTPDEPLTRPATPLGDVVPHLAAARLHRADVNRARAGVAARSAQVDGARANMLPNVGLGMRFDWTFAPGVQVPVSGFDPATAGPQLTAAFGIEWPLDFLTKNARVHQAEANLDEARSLERLALGGVAAEVEAAHAAAVEAATREENWDRAVRRAKSWIVAVQDAIDLGTKDERALVEPLRIYVLARASQLQALMDTHMTRAELARVTGWEGGGAT